MTLNQLPLFLIQHHSTKEKKPRPVSVEEKMEEQLQEFETLGDSQSGAVASLVRYLCIYSCVLYNFVIYCNALKYWDT